MAFNPIEQQGQPQPNRVEDRQPQPNRVEGMLKIKDTVRRGDMKDKISLMGEERMSSNNMSRLAPRSPGAMGGVTNVQKEAIDVSRGPTSNEIKEGAFNAAFENLAKLAGVDLVSPIKEVIQIAEMQETEAPVTRQYGGLIGLATGGDFSGKVPGQGHGMEDNVYMPIVERERGQQVATLAVSPDEYVVDAHTMSALGNGNADEGARYMDAIVKNIRKKAFGTDQQPNEINGLAALRPMIERV